MTIGGDQTVQRVRDRLALRLSLRMRFLGLRQGDVAEALCVSQQTVSKWLAGDALPTVDKIPPLASVLKCEIADLFVDGE